MNEEEARRSFERALREPDLGPTFMQRFLGVTVSVEEEVSRLEFPFQAHFGNRRGLLHGGVIATLFDIAMGTLHRETLGPGTTVALNTHYLRPVELGLITCEARFLKKGRRVSFLEARMRDAKGTDAAFATGTWNRVEKA